MKILSNIVTFFTQVAGRVRAAASSAPETELTAGAYSSIFWGAALCIFSVLLHLARNLFVYSSFHRYTNMFLNSDYEVAGFVIGIAVIVAVYAALICMCRKDRARRLKPKRYYSIALVAQILIFIHLVSFCVALYITVTTIDVFVDAFDMINFFSLFRNLLKVIGLMSIAVGCFDALKGRATVARLAPRDLDTQRV